MGKLPGYTGSIDLISGIRQKNNGSFALVEANAIQTRDDGTRLDTELDNIKQSLNNIKIPSAGASGTTNLINGYSIGSIRAIGSKEEDSSYKLGKYSIAEGLGTQSGAKAFTILGVDKTNKTYTLDSTEGLAIGDVYSAHVLYTTGGSTQAENYGKITAINGNVVTVDNLFCDNDFATADSYTDDGFDNEKNMFRIISKPNVGTRFIADVVHSEGVSTKALSKGSHAEGKGTTAYGSWSHAEGNNTKAGYGAHAEGNGTTASGFVSHAEGSGTTSSGDYSHTEGHETIASGGNSHAEGYKTVASGDDSHAEGSATKALGNKAHAEGYKTVASGDDSHAEGSGTTSSGSNSHAEGGGTTASGSDSHAEGRHTIASHDCSHAEGEGTKVSSYASHVQGRYNILDNNNYADIIGNGGSDTERSNAYTMDWRGNAWFAGDVYTKSTSGKNKDEGSKKLATEEYADDYVKNYVKTSSAVIPGSGNSSIMQNSVGAVSSGIASISFGSSVKTYGDYSVGMGASLQTYGKNAANIGFQSESYNNDSISLGRQNKNYSHTGITAGYNNIAGKEEYKDKQWGDDPARGAIAIGWGNNATHAYACVFGNANNSSRDSQTVFGQYCANDPNALFILGNGTSLDKRSNAYTVDEDGNGCFTGNVYVGSSKKDGEGSKRLATEEYVDLTIPSTTYNATIGTEWVGDAAPYTQTVAITGITVNDTPIVDIVPSNTDYNTLTTQLEEFGNIYRITTAANSITIYATEKTTVEIPIQLKCVK